LLAAKVAKVILARLLSEVEAKAKSRPEVYLNT
jgi:hypothetical protein